MKKTVSFITALILTAASASAQLLWKVEGNGLQAPSYIFGTHHVAPSDMVSRVAGLTDALDEVAAVYGEVNMVDLNPMEMQQMVMPHIMAPADSTLSVLFTPAQLDSIGALLTSYTGQPVDMSQMETLKPVMIGTQLAILQSMKAFPGFNPQAQLDATLQNMAKAAGKEVGGLETFEYQLGVLYDTPLSIQADELMEGIRNDSEAVEKAASLANAYTSGDLDTISSLLYDDPDMTQAKLEKLLLVRNRAWTALLPDIMGARPVLVAVGCGHLPGDEGLIALLRNAGYTLTPVDSKR